MKIGRSTIPAGSLTHKYLPVDYSDVYECGVPDSFAFTPDDIQVAFWIKSPKWVENLFKIRNKLVSLVGLKGSRPDSAALERSIRNGESYNMFSVLDKSENETIIKLSDSHLDAMMSVYIEENKHTNTKKIYLITLVQMHNLLGRIYFYAILPFHHLVVKGMLRNTLNTFIKESKL